MDILVTEIRGGSNRTFTQETMVHEPRATKTQSFLVTYVT